MSTPVAPFGYSRAIREQLEAALPAAPLDLLTEAERRALHEDLARMARMRRQAEVDSTFIVMH